MDPHLLLSVEKPSRYLGGEINQVRKELASVRCVVGLCYPDVYEIGMSHLGLQLLYQVVNARADLAAERVFCPWPDMEQALRRRGQPLATLENGVPLAELDILGFSLQHELGYTNVLTVLDLGRIPLRSAERTARHPLVLAGGPCAANPEPMAPFLDAVVQGDGEEVLLEVAEAVARWRETGRRHRDEILDALARIPGVYVPSRYRVLQRPDGTIEGVEARGGAPAVVQRRVVANLDDTSPLSRPVVPFCKAVHDRLAIEIQRGCARGCRFCQAGVLYRPVRERSPEAIRRAVRDGLRSTGVDEVGLLSLSTGDYTCLPELLRTLLDEHAGGHVSLSTPSLRMESLTTRLLDEVGQVRRSGITLAPEAGTARLRAVINKAFDEEGLLDAVRAVMSRGWRSIKLYFMVGLPTEQRADLEGIVDLARRCLGTARTARRGARVRVSLSSFVPKPHTPLQWCAQCTVGELEDKHRFLARELRRARIDRSAHAEWSSTIEGLLARGDRRLAAVIEEAWRGGARMDGWADHIEPERWTAALAHRGIDLDGILHRWREVDEILPWDHLSSGVRRSFLAEEYDAALEARPREDCTTSPCYDCGVCDPPRVRNRLYDRDETDARPRAVVASRPRPGDLPRREPPRATDSLDMRLPPQRRVRVRLRYARLGNAALLSHLETVQVLQRALCRTGAPVIYTAGYNPHIKMVFSDPNPVGMESDAEHLELQLLAGYPLERLVERLRFELPAGFLVHEAEIVPHRAPPLVEQTLARTYRIDGVGGALARRAAERLAAPLPVTVQRKRGERRVDLSQVASVVGVEGDALTLTLDARAGVRPAEVVEALLDDRAAAARLSLRKVDVRLASWPPEGREP